jgi:uncharacterized protein (TIGR02001 family)
VQVAGASARAARHARRRRRSSSAVGAILLALFASSALGQVSGSAALVSDYRYRGVSLSDGNPAVQLGVTYDDPRNWYAGLLASGVLGHCAYDCGHLQGIGYVGYAKREPSGLGLEVGGDVLFSNASSSYTFGELYLGMSYVNTSARVYFSPRYFGLATRSVYGELNQTLPLNERARLFAHAGVLRVSDDGTYTHQAATRVDVSLGAAVDIEAFEVTVSWQHAGEQATGYPTFSGEHRSGFVVRISRSF